MKMLCQCQFFLLLEQDGKLYGISFAQNLLRKMKSNLLQAKCQACVVVTGGGCLHEGVKSEDHSGSKI